MNTCLTRSPAMAVLSLAVLMTAGAYAAPTDRHTSHITFTGRAALPGVTLVPGTYVFEQISAGTPDVVVVRSLDRRAVYFMGITQPSVRPASLPPSQSIALREARRGEAPLVAGWYPAGEELGHVFVY